MEDIDGGLHPAVDGQSLDEMRDEMRCRLEEYEGDFGSKFRLLLASQSSEVGGDVFFKVIGFSD